MKLASVHIKEFKRFEDLTITDLPATARLVLLTGPNGCGKTSVFEAFNYWISCINKHYQIDPEYHNRKQLTETIGKDWSRVWNSIKLRFHGETETFAINTSFDQNSERTRKAFYIRSAYRHEPDFTSNGLQRAQNILENSNRAQRLIFSEARVSENYQRIVSRSLDSLFDPDQGKRIVEDIVHEVIGEIKESMLAVFDDLVLEKPGNPMDDGTFRFRKGNSSGFHYKNLSGGEKAAFDLLVDFIVKKKAFDDTIYCIDEPELHMHTRLQARLLKQLYKLIPENSQLWISTHSIGMARMAQDLHQDSPSEVIFLDFHDRNFDKATTISPTLPSRQYWKNMFNTALDDLSELILPERIVLCEGKRIGHGGRKPSFDASVYTSIFAHSHPNIEFRPLGGTNQVKADGRVFIDLISSLASGTKVWAVFDKDDRAEHEIDELKADGIHVLERRDLESYLWDDEILKHLCEKHGTKASLDSILAKKSELLTANESNGKPVDDVKAISGQLYTFVVHELSLRGSGCGNTAEDFARATLAPLVSPDTDVFKNLERIIFSNVS